MYRRRLSMFLLLRPTPASLMDHTQVTRLDHTTGHRLDEIMSAAYTARKYLLSPPKGLVCEAKQPKAEWLCRVCAGTTAPSEAALRPVGA